MFGHKSAVGLINPLEPFGPTVMRLPDPRSLRDKRSRARFEQVGRLVEDPAMMLMASSRLAEESRVPRIIAALPSADSCGLAKWPDEATLRQVANVGVMFALLVEGPGVIDPGLYLAAVMSLQKFDDVPVVDALFCWVAWMHFLSGAATTEEEIDAFFDACLVHARDLRSFAPLGASNAVVRSTVTGGEPVMNTSSAATCVTEISGRRPPVKKRR